MLEKGISGAEIARRCGVTRGAIWHVIEGRRKSKTLRRAIEKALGEKFWNNKNNNKRKAA
jgi:transcriptional regulator with XRE-family HTH domain